MQHPLMSLLEGSLHMRIDSETVIGVQGLASDSVCRKFSFITLCNLFAHPCDLESRTNLPRPSSRSKYCVFVCNLPTFQGYIICPIQTKTRQYKSRGARILITLSEVT